MIEPTLRLYPSALVTRRIEHGVSDIKMSGQILNIKNVQTSHIGWRLEGIGTGDILPLIIKHLDLVIPKIGGEKMISTRVNISLRGVGIYRNRRAAENAIGGIGEEWRGL